ncbi:uncharacterized protein METZ01_LOCUS468304, partial [marine metagenome]
SGFSSISTSSALPTSPNPAKSACCH